jgi:hypothetical protein
MAEKHLKVWHVRNLSERWQRLPLWYRRHVCTGHCSIVRRRRKSHELMIREGCVIELTGNSADLISQARRHYRGWDR